MKKQITELLASKNATLNINKFCTLHHWVMGYSFGNYRKGDSRLVAEFSITRFCSYSQEITARDLPGIIREVSDAQIIAFAKATEELNAEFRNGHIAGKEV